MKIYINDIQYDATEKETIIQVADRNNIHIPRFCYHKHLSVVASCRMCLVDIDKVKQAQPACSTLVFEEMRIYTKSQKTKEAQKSTMEFLLINHPLDCPICDQAGECELQDVSLQHGDSKSHYMQFKRVVIDEEISPLISTEMTRCIHCSRCVRFGEEIAKEKELGLLNRGEKMEIRSAITNGVHSELSGNMIDLCPVGALNNRSYSYKARTWDLKQHSGISPHDCIGSNIFYHTYDNKILRAVPKDNPDINQTWISDRDRFGFEGIYSEDRCNKIMRKINNVLVDVDEQMLAYNINESIKEHINKNSKEDIGCFVSGQTSCEEMFLLKTLLNKLQISNIDHRTNEIDFEYEDEFPIMPNLGCHLNQLSDYDNIILLGLNIKSEFPILSIRLNEAAKSGTKFYTFHYYPTDEVFKREKTYCVSPNEIINQLKIGIKGVDGDKKNLILLGPSINYLSYQTLFHSVVGEFSNKINGTVGYLTDYCNSTSGWLLGNIPHRKIGGEANEKNSKGLNVTKMLENKLGLLIFYNLEPEHDFSNSSHVIKALQNSKCNIFFTSYMSPLIEKYADYIIPITTFAETSGSYINIEGKVQSYDKIINPGKNVLEGWKILNKLCQLNDIDATDLDTIRENINNLIKSIKLKSLNHKNIKSDIEINDTNLNKYTLRHIYSTDQIVRRSRPLNLTKQAKDKKIFVSSDLVEHEDNSKGLSINENGKKYKINDFEINNDLPPKSVIYSSCYNNKLLEGKSSNIKIDK